MLVVLMQLGFIYLEMGCVRNRHRPGIAVKNFTILIGSTFAYVAIGFRLMYGEGSEYIGWSLATGSQLVPEPYGWIFFQAGFAAVAATILSGALAGRTTLFANVVAALVMAALVYPINGHWVWGKEGWLNANGAHDFAGSGVVHFVGGFAAAIAVSIAGHRRGWVDSGGKTPDAHLGCRSLPYASIGVIFLWIGWIGFNGGSVGIEQLNRDGFSAIGFAVLSTCCAACAGGVSALVASAFVQYRHGAGKHLGFRECLRQKLLFDPFAMLSGTMGGMVAMTANCDWIYGDYQWSFGIGAIGGLATFLTASFVKNGLRLDDPVEAIAVHAGAGAAGILVASISKDYFLGTQVLMLIAAAGVTTFFMLPTCLILRRFGLLRCSPQEERVGLTFEPLPSPILTKALAQEILKKRSLAHRQADRAAPREKQ